jgi:type I restriction enzyme S subunit
VDIDRKRIIGDWAVTCINHQLHRLIGQAHGGVGLQHVTKPMVQNLRIPLPPVPEQRRIAAILDKADAILRKREEGIGLAEELLRSTYLEMFGDPATNPKGWSSLEIGDIALQVTDGEHATPQRSATGIMLLSARNIQNGHLDLTHHVDYIPISEFERIRRRFEPTLGDVLISCSGTIGRVTTVEIAQPFSLVRSVALVRPNTNIVHPKYLEFYLQTSSVQRLLHRSANKSSQANLFLGPLKAIPVLVPPVQLQEQFVDWLATANPIRSKRAMATEQAAKLFASLVQRAFRGEL